MATVNEFLVQTKTHNAQVEAKVDRVVAAVDGIGGDVVTLLEKIEKLNNNPGEFNPADQALVDEILADTTRISDKLDGLATVAEELDAKNAPVPPIP